MTTFGCHPWWCEHRGLWHVLFQLKILYEDAQIWVEEDSLSLSLSAVNDEKSRQLSLLSHWEKSGTQSPLLQLNSHKWWSFNWEEDHFFFTKYGCPWGERRAVPILPPNDTQCFKQHCSMQCEADDSAYSLFVQSRPQLKAAQPCTIVLHRGGLALCAGCAQ